MVWQALPWQWNFRSNQAGCTANNKPHWLTSVFYPLDTDCSHTVLALWKLAFSPVSPHRHLPVYSAHCLHWPICLSTDFHSGFSGCWISSHTQHVLRQNRADVSFHIFQRHNCVNTSEITFALSSPLLSRKGKGLCETSWKTGLNQATPSALLWSE